MPIKEVQLQILQTEVHCAQLTLSDKQQKLLKYCQERLAAFAKVLTSHNILPECIFVTYHGIGFESESQTQNSKALVITRDKAKKDQSGDVVLLTEDGKLIKAAEGSKRKRDKNEIPWYYTREQFEEIIGEEFIHYAQLAFAKIGEIVSTESSKS
jgi:hypothetical protein